MANLSALQAGGVPSVVAGHTTLSAATGDVAVTGVGFKPTWIMVTGQYAISDASNVTSQTGYKNSADIRSHAKSVRGATSATAYNNDASDTQIYIAYNGALAQAAGNLKTFDADGFTIDRDVGGYACEIFWIVGR
tara:strand:- start:277 stop:681 length:405 start_codon:yes stop_codon:yes gene_type:complete